MFVVRTSLRPSAIHGTGVFAEEFIPKGAMVWKFHRELDLVIDKQNLEALEPATQEELQHYSWLDTDLNVWVLSAGHGAFVNHSDDPSMHWMEGGDFYAPSYAVRDIQPGEEITDNYSAYDLDFARKLGRGN